MLARNHLHAFVVAAVFLIAFQQASRAQLIEHSPASIRCSEEADARGLHGEQRMAFRTQCKARFYEQNPAATPAIPSANPVAQAADPKIEAKGQQNARPKRSFGGRRIALVVGNSAYQNVPQLSNPPNDARLIADTLQRLGFVLIGGSAQLDLDKVAFDKIVRSFGRQVPGADVGLFYYAGHGLQVHGANYLVPVDANPTREADLDFELEDVALVLRQMEGSGTRLNLVFLDACRNNPFGGRGLRAIDGGLAQMRAPEGTLISFATQPGSVAQDGYDGHSPFSKALAQTIQKPGLGIFDAMNEVGLAVKSATGGSQQPWFSTSPIGGAFYFASPPAAQQVSPPTNPSPATPQPRVPPTPTAILPNAAAPPKAATPTVEPETAESVALVLPKAVPPNYFSETPGQARMHTCVDQYNANKATGGNGGMKWIERGGGYYTVCNEALKRIQ
jgi:Caspase domain